jgi:predicted ribosomally synthesized peptide with nif11-like leader
MSIAEIERFAADLTSSEALRGEAAKVLPETSRATPMDRVVDRVIAFATSKGYTFTADDLKLYAKARKLADAELDGVAGGANGREALIESVAANERLEGDKAKGVQTELQSANEFAKKTQDFYSNLIDLLRGMSSKVQTS